MTGLGQGGHSHAFPAPSERREQLVPAGGDQSRSRSSCATSAAGSMSRRPGMEEGTPASAPDHRRVQPQGDDKLGDPPGGPEEYIIAFGWAVAAGSRRYRGALCSAVERLSVGRNVRTSGIKAWTSRSEVGPGSGTRLITSAWLVARRDQARTAERLWDMNLRREAVQGRVPQGSGQSHGCRYTLRSRGDWGVMPSHAERTCRSRR